MGGCVRACVQKKKPGIQRPSTARPPHFSHAHHAQPPPLLAHKEKHPPSPSTHSRPPSRQRSLPALCGPPKTRGGLAAAWTAARRHRRRSVGRRGAEAWGTRVAGSGPLPCCAWGTGVAGRRWPTAGGGLTHASRRSLLAAAPPCECGPYLDESRRQLLSLHRGLRCPLPLLLLPLLRRAAAAAPTPSGAAPRLKGGRGGGRGRLQLRCCPFHVYQCSLLPEAVGPWAGRCCCWGGCCWGAGSATAGGELWGVTVGGEAWGEAWGGQLQCQPRHAPHVGLLFLLLLLLLLLHCWLLQGWQLGGAASVVCCQVVCRCFCHLFQKCAVAPCAQLACDRRGHRLRAAAVEGVAAQRRASRECRLCCL